MAELDVAAHRKVLWLKRLHGDLDDDESSDSSPQEANVVAVQKLVRKKKPEKEGADRKRGMKRVRQPDEKGSDEAPSRGGGDAPKKRDRRLKKSDESGSFARHKGLVKAAKMVPREEGKKGKKSDQHRQSSLSASARKNLAQNAAAKRKLHKTGHSTTMEGSVESTVASSGTVSTKAKQQEEQGSKIESTSVAETRPVSSLSHGDETDELLTQSDQSKLTMQDEKESTIKQTSAQPVDDVELKGASIKDCSGDADGIAQVASSGSASSAKPDKQGASYTTTPSSEPLVHLKPEPKEESKTSSGMALEGVQEPVDKERTEKQVLQSSPTPPSPNKSVKTNCIAEERKDQVSEPMSTSNQRLEGESAALSSVGSFVIPKRSLGSNHGAAAAQTSQKTTGETQAKSDTHSIVPPVPVTLPAKGPCVLSPKSSSEVKSIRPSTKRSKQPVSIKSTLTSTQDQALMRLSRKRNSIFMAAAELAAQNLGSRCTNGVTMGYEVFGVEGKVFSDLIPRLSCVTKREMATNRASYAGAFFGVSLLPPKAKGLAIGDLKGSDTKDCATRHLSCYEELRFKRPEDREFYQRKMYGTAFVPQKLRGWITLIVRNACFERKSTGIRFNQDRDREEFASSLSKRYTLNKSIPRCDIRRENWQKLMRNQSGCVYLHYYNREDAEKASHTFRDDFGHPLELKKTLKAGVVVTCSLSPAAEPRNPRLPRRSHSSERTAPGHSPFSLQTGSARKKSPWRQDRQSSMKNDDQLATSRWNAKPLVPARTRDERRYDSYDGPSRRPCPPGRSRSRSRSGFRPCHGRQDDASTRGWSRGQNRYEKYDSQPFEADDREWTEKRGMKNSNNSFNRDADAPARKRARTYSRNPQQFSSNGSRYEPGGNDDREMPRGDRVNGARRPIYPMRSGSEGESRNGYGHANFRSERWHQEVYNGDARPRPDHFPRDHVRGPRFSNDQRSNGGRGKLRSRSRSWHRNSPTHSGRGDFHSNPQYERQRFRENERPPAPL
ncbi:hypothetical protein PsorP6_014469 [Peronosclerospora sorghi]|uniref:Uncharacterized protein n=1 Tax=Peronosclerospora sorghi TaxID=230839 RepID=A0ACC0VR94_9STRA|nr:hypothetical protein PsorP6_014469 [Peronosclerospora sorghi]